MWYDLFIIVILAYATIRGAVKGIVWQLAIIAALVLSFAFASPASVLGAQYVPVQPPLNRWLTLLVLYVVSSFVCFAAARALREWIEKARFVEYDRHLGALFGFVKGVTFSLVMTFFIITLSETARQQILQTHSGYAAAVIMDQIHPVMPRELHDVLEPYIHRLDDSAEGRLLHANHHDHQHGDANDHQHQHGQVDIDRDHSHGRRIADATTHGTAEDRTPDAAEDRVSAEGTQRGRDAAADYPHPAGVHTAGHESESEFDGRRASPSAHVATHAETSPDAESPTRAAREDRPATRDAAREDQSDVAEDLSPIFRWLLDAKLRERMQRAKDATTSGLFPADGSAERTELWQLMGEELARVARRSTSQPDDDASRSQWRAAHNANDAAERRKRERHKVDRLVLRIASIYSQTPQSRATVVTAIHSALSGLPDSVALAVLKDWHGDVLGHRPDVDAETDFATPLDARIVRQLNQAHVPFEQLSSGLQRRLQDAARR